MQHRPDRWAAGAEVSLGGDGEAVGLVKRDCERVGGLKMYWNYAGMGLRYQCLQELGADPAALIWGVDSEEMQVEMRFNRGDICDLMQLSPENLGSLAADERGQQPARSG